MSWPLTLTVIHVLAAMCAANLYCTAPDWIQKVVLGLIMVACLVLVGVYAVQATGGYPHWLWAKVALQVEHYGVLLYLFRLIYKERVCKSSSPSSQPSAA